MASDWKTLDKALELQQEHTREKEELMLRRVVHMREEGLSQKVIAERLNIGVWTVKTLLRRAAKKKSPNTP